MNKPLISAAAASLVVIVAASAAILPAVGAVNPAPAIAFGGLTTIYVGAGAYDSSNPANSGTATVVICGNVSGVAADIRVLMLNTSGGVEGSLTSAGVAHGGAAIFATHGIAPFIAEGDLATGGFTGVVNIESTQSGVFCTAMIMNAAGPVQDAVPLHLVRVNPHPGTVE